MALKEGRADCVEGEVTVPVAVSVSKELDKSKVFLFLYSEHLEQCQAAHS